MGRGFPQRKIIQMTEIKLLVLIGIALLAGSKIGKIVNQKTSKKNTRKHSIFNNEKKNAS